MCGLESTEVVDLSEFSSDGFCSVCHNLSLDDHGPALSLCSLSPGLHATDYFINSYLNHNGSSDGFSFAVSNDTEDAHQKLQSSLRCCWCRLILECSRHAMRAPESMQTGEPWQVIVSLRPRKNVRLYIGPSSVAAELQELQKSTFELYVTEPDVYPLPGQGAPAREPPPFCGEESLAFISQCLDQCQSQHTTCQVFPSPSLGPSRLIQIHDRGLTVSLVDTNSIEEQHVHYIALSHCWGDSQPIRTTKSSLAKHEHGILTTSLPRLFQDAISIVRHCGVHYIWIDSLCIVQDDRAAWATESAKMGSIYENALFTIAATRAKDGSVPIIGPQALNDPPPLEFHLNIDTVPTRLRVRQIDDEAAVVNTNGPLKKRAWAYQETALSRRLIQFTSRELNWRCMEEKWFQCRTERSASLHGAGVRPENWHWHVRNYSRRSLTFLSDKLPAISGLVANAVQKHPGAVSSLEYLAGLWFGDPGLELAWRRAGADTTTTSSPLDPANLALGSATSLFADCTTPSWSWASIAAGVSWPRSDSDDATGTVRLLRHSVAPATDNPYGQVKAGASLQLQAPIIDVEVRAVHGDGGIPQGYELLVPGSDHEQQLFTPDCALVPVQVEKGHDVFTLNRARSSGNEQPIDRLTWPTSHAKVKCMLTSISSRLVTALVLGSYGPPESAGEYQRLGHIGWESDEENWTKCFKELFEDTGLKDILLV